MTKVTDSFSIDQINSFFCIDDQFLIRLPVIFGDVLILTLIVIINC